MSCLKYVTVDFDSNLRNYYEKALFFARLISICKHLECKIFKSKKGIHVYIEELLPLYARIAFRSYLLDDPMRLEIDLDRELFGWCLPSETLFNAKCQKEYCYEEEEIDIEELEDILFGEQTLIPLASKDRSGRVARSEC